MGTYEFGYTYRHLCWGSVASIGTCSVGSPSSIDLNDSMGRWDLQIGQKRPLNKLILAHTGAVLALDWSPHSSSPATRQVELPEENVILGVGGGFGTGVGAKDGIVGGMSAEKEEDGEGKRGWIVSGAMDLTLKVLPS